MDGALILRAEVAHHTSVESRENFGVFFELEHERLLRALYLVTGQRDQAEDVMQ